MLHALETMYQKFIEMSSVEKFWLVTGFVGQLAFTARFLVQWIASERKKKSVVPDSFWVLSIIGSTIVLAYAIYRQDPVFILAYSVNNLIYIRNMVFIHRHKKINSEPEPTSPPSSPAASNQSGGCSSSKPTPPDNTIQSQDPKPISRCQCRR